MPLPYLTIFTDFTVKRARPQLSVYTTDYWILPNPYVIFPQAGPVEPLLKGYDCEFRSLVVEKHYKLIYTFTDELIEIHAVWDCRQEGWRLQEMFK